MTKKGQLGGVAFFVVFLALVILLAPVILKVAITMMDSVGTKFSAIDSTNKSSDLVTFTKGKLTGTMDWAIMFFVILNILLLIVTAFLIDVHPAFLIIYIIGAFVLVLGAPYTIMASEKVYAMSQFSVGTENVIQYIPMTEFMLNNFGVVIMGVLVLTGIIMYGKVKLFASQNTSGGGTY